VISTKSGSRYIEIGSNITGIPTIPTKISGGKLKILAHSFNFQCGLKKFVKCVKNNKFLGKIGKIGYF
jgi:hypothetical protein